MEQVCLPQWIGEIYTNTNTTTNKINNNDDDKKLWMELVRCCFAPTAMWIYKSIFVDLAAVFPGLVY